PARDSRSTNATTGLRGQPRSTSALPTGCRAAPSTAACGSDPRVSKTTTRAARRRATMLLGWRNGSGISARFATSVTIIRLLDFPRASRNPEPNGSFEDLRSGEEGERRQARPRVRLVVTKVLKTLDFVFLKAVDLLADGQERRRVVRLEVLAGGDRRQRPQG